MADDTPLPDDDRPRPRKKSPPRDDDERPGGRARRRDRDEEDEVEDWGADDRPRRRRRREEEYDPALSMVVPLNTSGLAIAAGYLGLVSVLCVPAPFALLLGLLALRHLKTHPKLDGKFRAVFAVVMGGIFTSIMLVLGVFVLLKGK
ncbi:hypothetical protein [Frigoriglobus tundricola]|uniref:DUF4190 domain-containing protein n=1 Tax=Frigoriglobus tundricola TaxID=2774151 RepID=A0A6M5YYJ5_9BACT|nr:hypothetical protein [Frigoriglobus tundricola]QJW99187.1 hypothetical protein FTUN_6787 [Frigoriglobus tundricola]